MSDVADEAWSGLVEFKKYRADQPRDARGRFAAGTESAADHLEAAADHGMQNAGAPIRTAAKASARELASLAIAHLRDRAGQLAASARTVVTSTKFAGASPVAGGGVEIRTTHELPGDRGHIAAYAQISPHHVRNQYAQAVLAALHSGLKRKGVPEVAMLHPPIAAAFKNGKP